MPEAVAPRWTTRRVFEYALLVVAVAIYWSAGWAERLHLTEGPAAQRINIRWGPDVSSAERSRAERELGLAAPEQSEGRTWKYFLRKRTREDVQRLLADPRIEDTFHIDRDALRVRLDRPDMSPRLRTLLESDRLDEVSAFLTVVATFLLWCSRRTLVTVLKKFARLFARILDNASESRRQRILPTRPELTIVIGLGILFLIPLLMYGPYEDEVVQATIMPNQVFYKELFHGRWINWLNNLGFGAPMPLGDPLMFHPIFAPLVAFTSLRVTLTAVWVVHVVVMVVYFLRLLAATDIRLPWLRVLLTACYITSAPSILYFYDSDWVQMAITWTLFPVLVFYLRAALFGEAREHFWPTALWLGLLFGFWVTNAHPGYIAPLALALGIYVVAAAPLDRRVYLCLGAAAALCAAIAAPRIYTLLREVPLFPSSATRGRDGTSVQSYVGAFLAPLVPFVGRSPFIGFGIGGAAVVAVAWSLRNRDAHLRGCAAAFVASAVLNVFPRELAGRIVPALSPWMFRDPMLFFGFLAGGYMLQRALLAPKPAYRYGAAALLLFQIAQQEYVFLVAGRSLGEPRANQEKLLFYRYQGQAFGLGRTLVDQAKRFGPRVYLSPEVDKVIHGNLSADGIHFSSDLVLLGLNPVNGWFKNVSVTTMQPPTSFMEGFITGDTNVINNRTLLDVLGINLVLTTEHETGVPPGVVVVDRPRVHDPRLSDLVLLANADAWPQAVLLRHDAYTMQLPVHEGCKHTAALCRDYEPLSRMRLDANIALQASNGRYEAHFPPSDQERLLFLSVMYRPEWKASGATGPLPVHAVANAFLGVTVPPGTTDVTVAFVPRVQIVLTWFGSIVFFATTAAVVVLRGVRRHRVIQPRQADVV